MTIRRILRAAVVGLALLMAAAGSTSTARAQVAGMGGFSTYESFSAYYGAPGLFGTSWGVPSYGVARSWSSFSSPYGAGYGMGLAPYSTLPGRYGVGLWRTGYSVPGYTYGASDVSNYYSTFPYPVRPVAAPSPPIGIYAPYFGPPSFYGR